MENRFDMMSFFAFLFFDISVNSHAGGAGTDPPPSCSSFFEPGGMRLVQGSA
jgi:hypothetical protein